MASSGLCLVANLLLAIFVVFCPQVNCIERGLQEKSTTVSPGIVSMSTEKATLKANVTATTEAPMTTPETPEPTPDDIEWLKFLHLKRNRYISDPEKSCHGLINCADAARLHDPENALFNETGPHAFCDVDGNSLKLSDIEDGMHVKIRAKNVNYPGHEYLYTADGLYGYIWYDKLRPKGSYAHQKQTWTVKKDSDGTFRFESTYWSKGNYLIANNDDQDYHWLYCDNDSSQNWNVELY